MSFVLLYPGFKKKAVTFSYDDGILQDKTTVSILKNHHRKGTFNLNYGQSGEEKFRNGIDCSHLDLKKDVSLYEGREVASHTYSHPHRETLLYEQQDEEFKKDIFGLEELTGKKVFGAAYPYGTYNLDTLRALKRNGLSYCRTTKSTYSFSLPVDFLLWHPTIHHRDKRILERLDCFHHAKEELALFYIWGHSYEFALDNNFSLLDDICSNLEKDEDIYYGTNKEIYDYVKSAERVYYRNGEYVNPSLCDIYLKDENGNLLRIPKEGKLQHE